MDPSAYIQPVNSQWCGPCCLAFSESAFGDACPPAEVVAQLDIDDEYGIGLFDLATFPLRRGRAVRLHACDARNFPVAWRTMTSDEIRAQLGEAAASDVAWKRVLLADLRAGATFSAEPVTEDQLRAYLRAGYRVTLYVDSAILYRHADGVWGHYVVLLEMTQSEWTVFDPHWQYGGVVRYARDLALFALYSVGGYCMAVRSVRGGLERQRIVN